ncbi:MAG: hypothetical protein LBV15_01030 [Planctomycetota bacterium]|jgi:hypothetical protein|nr:hypothetical protein [Planctomycetota bacterium]
MGLFDKIMGALGGAGGGKSDSKKEEIRHIFDAKVENGGDYMVLAGMNMVTTKKLTKEIRTYYNYIIGYKDGDDPEIVLMSTTNDLSSVDAPVICKKSECTKAEYIQKTGSYSILHPSLGNEPTDFGIIASAAWGAPGSGALIIPVSYLDESMPFMEFFQNRFARRA